MDEKKYLKTKRCRSCLKLTLVRYEPTKVRCDACGWRGPISSALHWQKK